MIIEEFKPVLKNKNFLYLWSSQFLSQLTINIMNFVFLIRLFEKTGSAIAVSFLWVAYSLPAILIGPFASATVDMVDRRKMLVITNFLQALTIFVYAISQKTSIFPLYGIVFVYSLLNQFYVPAEAATLPSVLSKKKLTQGNSLFFLTQQGSLVLGFGVAGLFNNVIGYERTLFLCAFFLFLAFISTIFLPPLTTKDSVPKNFELVVIKFFSRIVEGYNFIKSERAVLAPFLLLLELQILLQVILIEVPSIANNLLKIPLNTAGVYILVPAAIGAITGALILPKLIARGWRKKKIIENSLILLTILILIICTVIPWLPYTLKVIISFLIILLVGLSFVGVVIPSQTFMQESTPRQLRGRVFGNFWFLVIIASVLPVIFAGTVVEVLGIRTLLILLAVISGSTYFLTKKYGELFLNA